MSWATPYIEQLQAGKTVSFRPRGQSMKGKVNSGDLVTVEPLDKPLKKGYIVLCKVRHNHYLHLVKAVKETQVLIGNNRGGTNGWTPISSVYGICTKVEK
jgi:hypothetical protein